MPWWISALAIWIGASFPLGLLTGRFLGSPNNTPFFGSPEDAPAGGEPPESRPSLAGATPKINLLHAPGVDDA